MNTVLLATHSRAVATVAPVATPHANDPPTVATVANADDVVAPAKSLTRQLTGQCGHRSHRLGKGHRNPVSPIRERVARRILCFEMVRVARVATRLWLQWFKRGHHDFGAGHGGHTHYRVRAPP